MMIQLILTEEQQRLLDHSTEPVQVMDRTGRLLASVAVEVCEAEVAEAQRIAAAFDDLTRTDHGLSAEDLNRIAEGSRNLESEAPTLRDVIDSLLEISRNPQFVSQFSTENVRMKQSYGRPML